MAQDVNICDARLVYAQKCLFEGLSLHLPAGQWTCFLGPSGVGKTSLLRLMTGLPVGAEASAKITTNGPIPLKHCITYMAQTDLLLPWLTVLDNVLIGMRLRQQKIQKTSRERAISLLDKVGLLHAMKKKPAQLSGGMRQRAALARTLFEDKPVVLMDEPFSAVDAITKWRLQTLAANMLANKTVLLITHDPLEALRLGQRVQVLSGNPATLDQPLLLTGAPPRDINDPQIQQWYRELLMRLEKAQSPCDK